MHATRALALAIVATLAVGTGTLVARSGGSQREVLRSRESAPTTSATMPAETTVAGTRAPSVADTRGPAATTTRPSLTTTTSPARATTPLACRNSREPACGAFRWDPPPPANQPMRLSVTVTPSQPRVGQKVTFQVVAEDPDGDITGERVDYGDGGGQSVPGQPSCATAHGPWTPPKATSGRLAKTYEHSYSAAGNFTAAFTFRSHGPCPDPTVYASEGSLSVPLVVSA